MKSLHIFFTCAVCLSSLPACNATRNVPFRIKPGDVSHRKMGKYAYDNYASVPDTATGIVYRAVLKLIPYTRRNAFYGNWGGFGCRGGRPVDAMDEIFRRHDIAYTEARCYRTLCWADEACVEALKKTDPVTLKPGGRAYRERALSFFSNRSLAPVGKPVGSYVCFHEDRDCPIQSREDLKALFEMPSPGKSERMIATTHKAGNIAAAKGKHPSGRRASARMQAKEVAER